MNKIIRNIIIYSICGLLGLFYLYVIFLGRNPKVSENYRLFYIDHVISDWPGNSQIKYHPGQRLFLRFSYTKSPDYWQNVCLTKGDGWQRYINQYMGYANSSSESYIYLPMDKEITNGNIKITVNDFKGDTPVSVMFALSDGYSLPTKKNSWQSIGSFKNRGTFTYNIPSVPNNKMIVLKFISGDITFRLHSLVINEKKI